MVSHSGYIMTLANSIIGVGILAMPFCFQKCGIILSILLLIISNYVTRISCHYLIKTSLLTRRKSYEFLGFHAFGSSGKLLVELCIIGYLLGTCITYFVVVGDLGPQIITKMFALDHGHIHLRTIIMVAVTLICILPLGMLKNVDSLSTVFTASIGFYVCLVLKIILESKEHILANDWTEKVVYWRPAGILQCLPIFSMALSCQMQLFEVFASVNNQSIEKLNNIVKNATWICTCVYICVGFFGYVAFCTQAFAGNILVNFSPSFGSDVIKIGFILSVAFSFPLVIFPCRASIYSLLYRKGHTDTTAYIPETRFKCITIFIVMFALGIALLIPSVELIIGLVGSTIGVAICIMFPAASFRQIIKKESTERSLTQLIIVSGFCLMILGTYANLNAIDEQRSGAHLEELLPEATLAPVLINPGIIEQTLDSNPKSKKEAELMIKKMEAELKEKEASKVNIEPENPQVVLPFDEKHEPEIEMEKKLPVDSVEKVASKMQAVSPVPDKEAEKPPEKPLHQQPSNLMPPLPKIEPLNKTSSAQQQSINKEAIKKDEEVIAEEAAVKSLKDKDEELKKTKMELAETKQLLQITKEELKQEFAKQNKETQDLVVEKLAEVVAKIDGKVLEKASADNQENVKKKENQPSETLNKENQKEPNKGILLQRLAENESAKRGENLVYEPLSYKTGELMEHAKNNGKLEQRLPLPLALLINASQPKINETLQSNQANQANNSINVHSIGRDILQLKETPAETTLNSSASSSQKIRNKRNVNPLNEIAIQEKYLPQPQVNDLVKPGISTALDLKLHAIGDLKSVDENDNVN